MQDLLSKTPFGTITKKVGRYTFYKFYDASCTEVNPLYHEVLGHEVLGHQNAKHFAEGLAMGFARKTIIIKRGGRRETDGNLHGKGISRP